MTWILYEDDIQLQVQVSPPPVPIQSERTTLISAIVHWLRYSLAKHARFCEPGIVTYPDAIFNILFPDPVEDNWGKTGGVLVS